MLSSKDPVAEISLPPFIGCAGWGLQSALNERFPVSGTHLERYAQVFPAVEINSSFYRSHRPQTYARWRDSVPDAFRFSVKLPRLLTHERRLLSCHQELKAFISECSHLEHKLGCLLVQLPPSLRHDPVSAAYFFQSLRAQTNTAIVCEPRHASWFSAAAAALLADFQIGYVDADPAVAAHGQTKSALTGIRYIRLHGSPDMYRSSYSNDFLEKLCSEVTGYSIAGMPAWCIFDNTASGAALPNALDLLAMSQARLAGH